MRWITALLSIFLSLPVIAALKIEVKHSEAASYLHFLSSGFEEPFTSGAMKEVIAGNDIFSENDLRNDYSYFKGFLSQGYNFDDEVPNRAEGFWAEDAMTVLAVTAPDLGSFEKQLSALMPYRGITAYYKVKEKAYPLFRSLVWDRVQSSQGRTLEKTLETIEKKSMAEWLEKAKAFYRSAYPDQVPFKVGLVPIPDLNLKSKHTSALNLRDVQVVPYLLETGVQKSLDVIFHEFCHALYEGQSAAVKTEINEFYLNQKDPHARFAYRYLNEALATAWGNGWFYDILNGHLSEDSWYAVDYIDKLAKAYFPLLKSWVNAGKTLDRDFMLQTVELAKKAFPNGHRELAPNFLGIRLLVERNSVNHSALKKELKRNFRIQSFKTSAPMEESDWTDLSKKSLSSTVLVTSTVEPALKRLQGISDLNSLRTQLKSKKDFLVVVPIEGNFIFWFNVSKDSSIREFIEKLKVIKLLPEKPSLL